MAREKKVICEEIKNANDPRRAFDQALKNLERQIKRHNDYLKKKGQYQGDAEFSFSLDETVEAPLEGIELQDPVIEKVKRIPVHPMDPKEAAMQMDLVGHTFFMFQNADTGDINVVYKRKDGNYGRLEPMK